MNFLISTELRSLFSGTPTKTIIDILESLNLKYFCRGNMIDPTLVLKDEFIDSYMSGVLFHAPEIIGPNVTVAAIANYSSDSDYDPYILFVIEGVPDLICAQIKRALQVKAFI